MSAILRSAMGGEASYSRATVTSLPVMSRTVPRKLTTAPHPGWRTLSTSAVWSMGSRVSRIMELPAAHRRDEGDLVCLRYGAVVWCVLAVNGQSGPGDQADQGRVAGPELFP